LKKKFYFKIVGNTIFYLLLIFFVMISFSMLRANKLGKQPEIFGYKFYVILTGSMSPNIEVGDLIITKETPIEEIKVNDVITFGNEGNSEVVTHRVKDIINDNGVQFATQGDANNTRDFNPVKGELVQGKVVNQIPKVGTAIKFMNENLLKIILAIFIISIIIIVTTHIRKKTKRKKVEN